MAHAPAWSSQLSWMFWGHSRHLVGCCWIARFAALFSSFHTGDFGCSFLWSARSRLLDFHPLPIHDECLHFPPWPAFQRTAARTCSLSSGAMPRIAPPTWAARAPFPQEESGLRWGSRSASGSSWLLSWTNRTTWWGCHLSELHKVSSPFPSLSSTSIRANPSHNLSLQWDRSRRLLPWHCLYCLGLLSCSQLYPYWLAIYYYYNMDELYYGISYL